MSDNKSSATQDEQRFPAVASYGPSNVTGLVEGELKKWCTCGLSKTQPWCDGTHKGTGFRSLKWTVPSTQAVYSVCQCKHTKNPPYCDGTHNYLPSEVQDRQSKCKRSSDGHTADCKLCTSCGWKPDF